MWRARTEAIDVEVLVDDDVQQRVARRALHSDLLPVSVDEVHRHLVIRPEEGGGGGRAKEAVTLFESTRLKTTDEQR